MKLHLCALFLFFHSSMVAQSTFTLTIQAKYGLQNLVLGKQYPYGEKDSVQITQCKFYLSGIALLKDQSIVYVDPMRYHLIDFSKPESRTINMQVKDPIDVNQIGFRIGIDSAINTSGALGGDLDPTNGMYWTWQSGYINIKLEGTGSLIKTSKHQFQLHLGGYQHPFSSSFRRHFPLVNNREANIVLSLESFLQQAKIGINHQVMSPSEKAVSMSKLFSECLVQIK